MFITLDNTDYYAYTGSRASDPGQETIVFIHGAAMDHTVWAHQSRYFAWHGYNVIALDLPGHRLSQGQLLDSITDMATWLNAIIGQLSGTAVHLVGHSMGALIALETAATYTAALPLHTLSLVGFCYPMPVTPKLMAAAHEQPSAAYAMMTQWSHASPIGGEPVPGFWSAGMQMSMMENSAAGAIAACLRACDQYRDGAEALDRVSCPILFLSGELDKMAPAKLARQEAERNARAQITLLPKCGHNLMSESPHGVLDALKSFF